MTDLFARPRELLSDEMLMAIARAGTSDVSGFVELESMRDKVAEVIAPLLSSLLEEREREIREHKESDHRPSVFRAATFDGVKARESVDVEPSGDEPGRIPYASPESQFRAWLVARERVGHTSDWFTGNQLTAVLSMFDRLFQFHGTQENK